MSVRRLSLALALLAAGQVAAQAPAMPPAGQHAPKLEAELARLLEAQWPGEKVLKLVIVSKTWTVESQRRFLDAAVLVRQAKGCRLFSVRYEQPAAHPTLVTTVWGPTRYGAVGDSTPFPCD